MTNHTSTVAAPAGVQSVQRAFCLLEVVAAGGGEMAIGAIASASGLPLPTIHRLLSTTSMRRTKTPR